MKVNTAFDQDTCVSRVQADTFDAANVLLLVHESRSVLLRARIEPYAVVHACCQMARPQCYKCWLDVGLHNNFVALLVRALDDSHFPERSEVGHPVVASCRQCRELREVAVNPTSFSAEGQDVTVFRPMHLCYSGLGSDLYPLTFDLFEVLDRDDSDPIVAGRGDLPCSFATTQAIKTVGMILDRRELLLHLPHLRADDHNIAQRKPNDQEPIAKPTIAFDCAVLHLE
mmetsp:Transcript_90862/g.293379  ORF Transcript_90862/g.293379 Transcript_90862/m.293379 type:complete len:228 (+) Transcript_90862:2911-3594(+)